MKKADNLWKRLVLAVVFAFCFAGLFSLAVQAAGKTVKKVSYTTELTEEVKSKATVVKKGITKLNVKEGFLKFNVPVTETYSFIFSGQTSAKYDNNNGYAYFLLPTANSYDSEFRFEHVKFKTTGGKTTTAWFHTKNFADTKKTTGAFLAKRTCKMTFQKGQTVYLYLYFSNKGSINLEIKQNNDVKGNSGSGSIKKKTVKTYLYSEKNLSNMMEINLVYKFSGNKWIKDLSKVYKIKSNKMLETVNKGYIYKKCSLKNNTMVKELKNGQKYKPLQIKFNKKLAAIKVKADGKIGWIFIETKKLYCQDEQNMHMRKFKL